jgi:uncharacterized membrane protein YuzA (DUF378 family)
MNITEEDSRYISMEALQHNMKQLDIARTFLCIIGGVWAGLMGLTSNTGFFSFVVLYVIIGLSIGMKMGYNFKAFTNASFFAFVSSDLQKNSLSFILFWTLTYALVYIY